MTARITPRRGRAIDRIAVDDYAPYWIGEYRGMRDVWLIMARSTDDDELCEQRVQQAINAHRNMMRCLREYRREQRMMEAA
jgi:hypothetical protein